MCDHGVKDGLDRAGARLVETIVGDSGAPVASGRCRVARNIAAPGPGWEPGGAQAHSNCGSSRGAAAEMGGAREGRSRQSKILRIASGDWMAARIRSGPPHREHSSTSIWKEHAADQLCPGIVPGPGPDRGAVVPNMTAGAWADAAVGRGGTIWDRHLAAGASTPW